MKLCTHDELLKMGGKYARMAKAQEIDDTPSKNEEVEKEEPIMTRIESMRQMESTVRASMRSMVSTTHITANDAETDLVANLKQQKNLRRKFHAFSDEIRVSYIDEAVSMPTSIQEIPYYHSGEFVLSINRIYTFWPITVPRLLHFESDNCSGLIQSY